MKTLVFVILAFLVSALPFGCSSVEKNERPARDEVLQYQLSYDVAFLRVFEALENVYGWELE